MNIGSISPDVTGAKRSRRKVGPQFWFRACDSVLFLGGMIGIRVVVLKQS